MTCRRVDCAWVAAVLAMTAPAYAAADHWLTLVVNGQPQRMAINPAQVKLVARHEASSLICVQVSTSQGMSKKWAMPEFWMTEAGTVDAPRAAVVAPAGSGANGLGNLRELRAIKQEDCG